MESTFSFQPTKNHLQQILKGMKYLSYTLDVWTSPNSKAFMAITIHGITSDWKMLDILVGMPAVYGRHTGHNFAEIFVDTLDDLEISNALFCITADNTSNNITLATRVEEKLGGIFNANTRLLGCMAHIINLAAHDSLKVFGSLNSASGPNIKQEVTLNNMDFNTILDRPNGVNVNLQTVDLQIHGLATYVRNSPQQWEGFAAVIALVNSQFEDNQHIKENLILKRDVRTRWNSTYIMLKRALKLRLVCLTYCASSDQVTADEMVKKLSKYLTLALAKPAPICAMILNPRIKLSYFQKNQLFFAKHKISQITPEDAFQTFSDKATDFDPSPSYFAAKQAALKSTTTSQPKSQKRTVKNKPKKRVSAIEADIFGEASVANDLTAEINQYIS
ncbi:hypothetical protein PSTT_02938 [Puccinia striiformis]|uniref:hAT-like transposase RNase-H fold domain-containing protein n=1 Tax=Puccinia striiformis TaxID=27350 RepID=A0A2S4VY43_9BASI|nr:hypothetical protein PSTT_02938 [Puccinia striiformis]